MTRIRVHATNTIGTGAIQLFGSLFPELAATGAVRQVYVAPEVEAVARRAAADQDTEVIRTDRRLPKAASRMLECTVLARRFRGEGALLVLGDIPLRRAGPQVVLVHSPYIPSTKAPVPRSEWKYVLSRALFAANAPEVSAFVVQTQVMKDSLEASYPAVRGRVHVIPQPPPDWVLRTERLKARRNLEGGLHLFYPAAGYPHKNHGLLRRIELDPALVAAVKRITVTLAPTEQSGLEAGPVRCVGRLDSAEMIRGYQAADALLFLSKKETYGFPLLEAMWLGLPILCPELPYARWMCGPDAVYFDPDSPASLRAAVLELHGRLSAGWRPDWTVPLRKIPASWADCAQAFLDLCELVEREGTR